MTADPLLARREALLARSARLRRQLGEHTQAIGTRLQWTESVVAIVTSRPARWVLALAAVFVGVGRPRGLLRVVRRAVLWYPAVRPLLPWVARWWRKSRPIEPWANQVAEADGERRIDPS